MQVIPLDGDYWYLIFLMEGFIFVIAPFAFSHFMEINEELKQIARMAQS